MEVLQSIALGVQINAKTLEKFRRRSLDDRLLGRLRRLGGRRRQENGLRNEFFTHHNVAVVVVGVVGANQVEAGRRRYRCRRLHGRKVTGYGGRLLNVLVLVDHYGVDVVDERLAERGAQVFVFVVQFLFVVVRGGESLPAEGVYEQRVLLEVLLERVLLRDDSGVLIVDVVVVVVGSGDHDGSAHRLVVAVVGQRLAVLGVVQLFVAEVVEREFAACARRAVARRGRVDGSSLARTETQHGPHGVAVAAAAAAQRSSDLFHHFQQKENQVDPIACLPPLL